MWLWKKWEPDTQSFQGLLVWEKFLSKPQGVWTMRRRAGGNGSEKSVCYPRHGTSRPTNAHTGDNLTSQKPEGGACRPPPCSSSPVQQPTRWTQLLNAVICFWVVSMIHGYWDEKSIWDREAQWGGNWSNSGSSCSRLGQHGIKRAREIPNAIRTYTVQNLKISHLWNGGLGEEGNRCSWADGALQ